MKSIFKYLPYEKYTLRSSLCPEDIQSVLLGRTARHAQINYSFIGGKRRVGSQDFEGKIDSMQFEISPVLSYRNSFKPTAKGNIKKAASGSTIEIECRMHNWVYIFLVFWIGFLLFMLLNSLTNWANGYTSLTAIPLIMIVFGYGLALGGFKYESILIRNKLKDALNAEIK